MGTSDGQVIIIVDATSVGKYFVPRLHSLGFRLIHIFSSSALIPLFQRHFEDIRHGYGSLFEEWIEYDGDLEKLHEYLIKKEPVAVFAGSDSGSLLAEKLAEVFHIPSTSDELVQVRNNELRMLQFLTKNGVKTKDYFHALSLDELLRWAVDHDQWPICITQIKDNSTHESHVCFTIDEIKTTWKKVTARKGLFSEVKTDILAEICLTGAGYAVNTVSHAGNHYVSDIWEIRKVNISGTEPFLDLLKLCPYPKEGEPHYPVLEFALKTLDTLGISHGPAHCEIMFSHHEPCLNEFHAMVMTTAPSPDVISECIGHNQVDWTIENIIHPDKFLQQAAQPYRITKYLIEKFLVSKISGKIRDISFIDHFSDLESLSSVDFFGLIETLELKETKDLASSPGTIVLIHNNEAILMADYQKVSDLEEMQDVLYEMEYIEKDQVKKE